MLAGLLPRRRRSGWLHWREPPFWPRCSCRVCETTFCQFFSGSMPRRGRSGWLRWREPLFSPRRSCRVCDIPFSWPVPSKRVLAGSFFEEDDRAGCAGESLFSGLGVPAGYATDLFPSRSSRKGSWPVLASKRTIGLAVLAEIFLRVLVRRSFIRRAPPRGASTGPAKWLAPGTCPAKLCPKGSPERAPQRSRRMGLHQELVQRSFMRGAPPKGCINGAGERACTRNLSSEALSEGLPREGPQRGRRKGLHQELVQRSFIRRAPPRGASTEPCGRRAFFFLTCFLARSSAPGGPATEGEAP